MPGKLLCSALERFKRKDGFIRPPKFSINAESDSMFLNAPDVCTYTCKM